MRVAALLSLTLLIACGEDALQRVEDPAPESPTHPGDPSPSDPTLDPDPTPDPSGWFGLAGSELAPWTQRIAAVDREGGISRTPGYTDSTVAAMTQSGWPVVAWADASSGSSQIYLRLFDGNAWVELAGSASGSGVSQSAGYASQPSLVVDDQDRPIVAWQDDSSGIHQIYVSRYEDEAWVGLDGSNKGGGVSGTTDASYLAALTIGSDGQPIVAWQQLTAGGDQIYLRKFDGTRWVDLDGSGTGGGLSNTSGTSARPSVAVGPSGEIFVAWSETNEISSSSISVRVFRDGSWNSLGSGLMAEDSYSNNPKIVVDSAGRPLVAWQAFAWRVVDQNEIELRRLENGLWIPLPGATGGGFYLNGTTYWPFSMTLQGDQPLVAWSDNTSGVDEVHFARFDGSTWLDVEGSASTTGVSNSDAASSNASVVVGDDRVCIAWTESDSAMSQAVLRCHTTP